jgi:hypothetical protein
MILSLPVEVLDQFGFASRVDRSFSPSFRSCEKRKLSRRLTPITRIRTGKELKNLRTYYSVLICVIGVNLRLISSRPFQPGENESLNL